MVRKDKATTSQTSAFYVAQGPSVDLAVFPVLVKACSFPAHLFTSGRKIYPANCMQHVPFR